MLERVMSGGHTGADQAGLWAAKASGIATGGWMPEGFLTEAGPRPDFAEIYGAVELIGGGYAERTRATVRDSDGTIWFGDLDSPGAEDAPGVYRLREACLPDDRGPDPACGRGGLDRGRGGPLAQRGGQPGVDRTGHRGLG